MWLPDPVMFPPAQPTVFPLFLQLVLVAASSAHHRGCQQPGQASIPLVSLSIFFPSQLFLFFFGLCIELIKKSSPLFSFSIILENAKKLS